MRSGAARRLPARARRGPHVSQGGPAGHHRPVDRQAGAPTSHWRGMGRERRHPRRLRGTRLPPCLPQPSCATSCATSFRDPSLSKPGVGKALEDGLSKGCGDSAKRNARRVLAFMHPSIYVSTHSDSGACTRSGASARTGGKLQQAWLPHPVRDRGFDGGTTARHRSAGLGGTPGACSHLQRRDTPGVRPGRSKAGCVRPEIRSARPGPRPALGSSEFQQSTPPPQRPLRPKQRAPWPAWRAKLDSRHENDCGPRRATAGEGLACAAISRRTSSAEARGAAAPPATGWPWAARSAGPRQWARRSRRSSRSRQHRCGQSTARSS